MEPSLWLALSANKAVTVQDRDTTRAMISPRYCIMPCGGLVEDEEGGLLLLASDEVSELHALVLTT
jgi:hypothetical protein